MIGRRKLLGNSAALVANRLAQSLTSFVLFAFIARILGAYQLGQYTLAFTYYFVFMTLAAAGLKTLFTRELSRNPEETPIFLVSGTLLQFIFSVLGYAALVITVFVLPYQADTSSICYIMGLMIFPFALSNITEAIFQAYEKMYLIAISTVPVYILRVLVMIWAMNLHYGVNYLAAIMVISEALILVIEWLFILPFVKPQWQIDWSFIWRTCKAAWVFLFIEGMAVIKERMQILILSLLGGEVVVGMFGAVVQLMQPFLIIANSLVLAVFPSMSKTVELGKDKQRNLTEGIVEILLGAALPLVIGIFFIGEQLLVLVYQDSSFAEGAIALNIVALGTIISAINKPLSFALVANKFEKINLFEVFITSIIGGLASIFLVSAYKLNGAAIATLFMQVCACIIYVYAVYSRLFVLNLQQTIGRPLLISVLMALVFLGLQQLNLNIVITLITATLAYILIVAGVGIYALGGVGKVKEKVLNKFTKK